MHLVEIRVRRELVLERGEGGLDGQDLFVELVLEGVDLGQLLLARLQLLFQARLQSIFLYRNVMRVSKRWALELVLRWDVRTMQALRLCQTEPEEAH